MVGNMQRKIVGLVLIAFMVPSFVQGMIVNENQARGLAAVGGVAVVSLGAMSQSPHAHEHVGGIFAAGIFFGGLSYLYLREHTPGQISYRAEQKKQEIAKDPLGAVLFSEDLNRIDQANTLIGYYSGNYPRVQAVAKLDRWEAILNKHSYWLDKAKAYDVSITTNQMTEPIKTAKDIRNSVRNAPDYQQQVTNSFKEKEVDLKEQDTARENSKYNWKWWRWFLELFFPTTIKVEVKRVK